MGHKQLISIFALILCGLFIIQPASAYSNAEYGFSITPPLSWTEEQPTDVYNKVLFVSPTGYSSLGVAYEYAPDTAFSDYIVLSKQNEQQLMANYAIESEGYQTLGDLTYYNLVFTFTSDSTEIKERQAVFMGNSGAYIVTFATYPSLYDQYLPDFQGSLETFKLLTRETYTTPWSTYLSAMETTKLYDSNASNLVFIIGGLAGAASVAVMVTIFILYRRSDNTKRQTPIIPSVTPPATRLCIHCGTNNDTDAEFCEKCGQRVNL